LVDDGSQVGFGDILGSAFLSPKGPNAKGVIWGAGPALSLPFSRRAALGSGKWSIGPTVVALNQSNGTTTGFLANHLCSFAGDADRGAVNATFFQPFFSYTAKPQTTFALNSETTYDWMHSQWTIPVNLLLSQLVKVGAKPMQLSVGYKRYLEGPRNSPDWGIRLVGTLLLAK